MTNPNSAPLQFTVNGNGDTADTLLTNYRAVLDAAQELAQKMAESCPHGRNYQTIPDGQAKLAEDITQWNECRVMVQSIADTALASAMKAMGD